MPLYSKYNIDGSLLVLTLETYIACFPYLMNFTTQTVGDFSEFPHSLVMDIYVCLQMYSVLKMAKKIVIIS